MGFLTVKTVSGTVSGSLRMVLGFILTKPMYDVYISEISRLLNLKSGDFKVTEQKDVRNVKKNLKRDVIFINIYSTMAIYLFLLYMNNYKPLVYKEQYDTLIDFFNIVPNVINYYNPKFLHIPSYVIGLLDNDYTFYNSGYDLTTHITGEIRIDVFYNLIDIYKNQHLYFVNQLSDIHQINNQSLIYHPNEPFGKIIYLHKMNKTL